jgi:hypothetical protein
MLCDIELIFGKRLFLIADPCAYRKTSSLLAPDRIIPSGDDRPDALVPSAIHFTPQVENQARGGETRTLLIVLQCKVRGGVRLTNSDRWFPSMLDALRTIRPEALVRWDRAGFRRSWRWKLRHGGDDATPHR